jgi:hypothetical protein
MKKINLFLLLIGMLLTACTMPASANDSTVISTAAALTVEAALSSAPSTPLVTPTQKPTQPTATLTAVPPMISVGDVVNCRKGPGKDYDRIAQVVPNEPVKIIGYSPPNYWLVSTANGECWVSAEFATPSGNFGKVPRVTALPTTVGGVPEPPSFSKNGWGWFCYGTGLTDVELNWNDNADNEKGYRIYRNNEFAVELPANSTYFKENILYPGGQGLQYKVEAFNETGSAAGTTDVLFCD